MSEAKGKEYCEKKCVGFDTYYCPLPNCIFDITEIEDGEPVDFRVTEREIEELEERGF